MVLYLPSGGSRILPQFRANLELVLQVIGVVVVQLIDHHPVRELHRQPAGEGGDSWRL